MYLPLIIKGMKQQVLSGGSGGRLQNGMLQYFVMKQMQATN